MLVQTELQRINQRLNPALQEGFRQGAALVDLSGVMAETQAATSEELFFYFSMLPGVREWKNGRRYHDIATRAFAKRTTKYELSFMMDEDQHEDAIGNPETSNAFNAWANATRQVGYRYAEHRFELYAAMLNAGLTETWPVDGQFFYDSDHPLDPDAPTGTTFSNRFDTVGGTARPLTHANADDVYLRFRAIHDERNKPIVLGNIVAEVPRALETKATQIWEDAMVIPAATLGANVANLLQPNPNKGRVSRIIVNDWLDSYSTTRWYLHCIGGMASPFMWMNRRAVRTREFTAANSEIVSDDGQYKYKTDARYTCFPVFPHLSVTADV
jgi:phage major head subunit gpT-like protein